MRLAPFALAALALMACAPPAPAAFYTATLTGMNESPPNTSPGTGTALVEFDPAIHLLHVQIAFSGLEGTTTASHIHAATAVPGVGNAGVATQTPTFLNFPLGVTSGSYDMTFDTSMASTYNPAFVTANGASVPAAEAALGASLAAGTAYLNIHTTMFPGGEIRGFLEPVTTTTPAPAGLVLALAGVATVGVGRLARRRRAG
jgi:hypothetical protein